MKKLILSLLVAATLTACSGTSEQVASFRDASPTEKALTIAVLPLAAVLFGGVVN